MKNMQVEVFFSAVDSLYFRGSRPHSAAGASSLPSDFPPSIGTLTGALRTRLGDALNIQWDEISENNDKVSSKQEFSGLNLAELIGSSKDTGLLQFSEQRLYKNKQRLYPVPSILLQSNEGNLVRMELGEPVICDLGRVHLPSLPKGVVNAKPLDNAWITEAGLNLFIQGKLPNKEHIVKATDMFSYESRLGIGRDVALATVKPGLLYQTEHLRLETDVEFSVVMSLPEEVAEQFLKDIADSPLQRFGGEGRMAELRAVKKSANSELLEAKAPNLIMLLTDMLADEHFASTPIQGFEKVVHQNFDCWQGEISGVEFRLLTVVSGKAKRIGGWDIRNNKPRDVQNYIPAGSCFFVEALSDQPLGQLTGKQIGRRVDCGFGTLLCAQIV